MSAASKRFHVAIRRWWVAEIAYSWGHLGELTSNQRDSAIEEFDQALEALIDERIKIAQEQAK